MSTLVNIARGLLGKIAAAALILGLGLMAGALWMFLRDDVDYDLWRGDQLRTLSTDRRKIQGALAEQQKRLDQLAADAAAEEAKAKTADGVIAQLKQLESTWDRLVGNPEQQRANAEQIAHLQTVRTEALARADRAKQEFNRTTWERDGFEISLAKLKVRMKEAETKKSKVAHYVEKFWHYPLGRPEVGTWIMVVLIIYFFGVSAGKIGLYFVIAPRISLGRPVRFTGVQTMLPTVTASRDSIEISLLPGERLRIKKQFSPVAVAGVIRKSRWFLDGRIPFSCLTTGLIRLDEIESQRADANLPLRLADTSSLQSELAMITLPEGASLILRPSFLAGVVIPTGSKWRIRRRWQLTRWQAWLTSQFRFFEFVGPCRLMVAANPSVQIEILTGREGAPTPAQRAAQGTTIGFSPSLNYRPIRAEKFWSYYRGLTSLFDDHFAGEGIFLSREIPPSGEGSWLRRFWSGLIKIFGL